MLNTSDRRLGLYISSIFENLRSANPTWRYRSSAKKGRKAGRWRKRRVAMPRQGSFDTSQQVLQGITAHCTQHDTIKAACVIVNRIHQRRLEQHAIYSIVCHNGCVCVCVCVCESVQYTYITIFA